MSGQVAASGNGWSDRFKWWMDVLKTLVTAILGFGLTYLLLDNLQQRRTEERAVCAADVTRMQRALEEFERAGIAYRRATIGAFNELYRWRDEQPTDPIRQFWGAAYTDLQASLEHLRRRLPADQPLRVGIEGVEAAMKAAYDLLDPLIDSRLDRIEAHVQAQASMGAPGAWARDPAYVRALAPLPRDTLDKLRRTLDQVIGGLDATRAAVVDVADRYLARPASDLCKLRGSS